MDGFEDADERTDESLEEAETLLIESSGATGLGVEVSILSCGWFNGKWDDETADAGKDKGSVGAEPMERGGRAGGLAATVLPLA